MKKNAQIAAGGLALVVLLAGAFVAGRQHAPADAALTAPAAAPAAEVSALLNAGAGEPPAATPKTQQAAAPAQQAPEPPAARQQAQVQAAPVAPVAPTAPAAPKLCSECATVVAVRTEHREGQASGLGAVGGAVLGGVLGHQVGGGTGKQLATVAGAAAGGYAGNQVEKNQKAHQVWIVGIKYPDGGTRSFEFDHQPDFRVNSIVRVRDGVLEHY